MMNAIRVAFVAFLLGSSVAATPQAPDSVRLLLNTDALETWKLEKLGRFAALDSGNVGAGSFANTTRTTDPQGGYAADFIQEDSSHGYHYAALPLDLPAGTYTVSAWLKAAGRAFAELNVSGDTSAAGVRFDLANGVVQTAYQFGPWAVVTNTILTGEGGWHYCTATFRLTGSEAVSVLVLPALAETNKYQGDNQSGTFVWNVSVGSDTDFANPVTPDVTPPLLSVAEHSRYLVDPNGKAVFLTGAHTWNSLQDWSARPPFDFELYLDKLRSSGHNCTRIWQLDLLNWDWIPWGVFGAISPLPWNRTGPGTAVDGRPKLDLISFNEAFFERLRIRVAAAGAKGIYAKIMLFEGCWVRFTQGTYFHHSPYNAANNVNGAASSVGDVYTLNNPALVALQEKYVAKVIDAVNGFDNVIYEIINEAPPSSSAWQSHMVNFIKRYQEGKPKQHPAGMSAFYPSSGWEEVGNRWLRESPSDWISIYGGQVVRHIYGTNPPALGPVSLESNAAFETWDVTKINPFRADDSGRPGAGSFSSTRRTTDPRGGYTADFLQEDGSAGYHFLARPVDLPAGIYTVSAWLKAAGRTFAELNISGETSAVGVRFDLGTGAVQSSYEHGPWTVLTNSISPDAGGWYQCTATFSLTGVEPTSILILPSLESTHAYQGDNTAGVFAWNVSVTPLETKVAFLDSDHVWGIGGAADWVWKAFTRGYNILYMDPHETSPRDLGWGWTFDPTAMAAMGDALSYANRMNLAAMSNSPGVSSTGYVLSAPGVEYLVWQPDGANEITLQMAAGHYSFEWFDPASRRADSGAILVADGHNRFLPPPANTSGSVLYLKARSP